MNCQICHIHFDLFAHVPLFLPTCDHSFCQNCVSMNLKENQIKCFKCSSISRVQSIVDFPKNMALLDINQVQKKEGTSINYILDSSKHSKSSDLALSLNINEHDIDLLMKGAYQTSYFSNQNNQKIGKNENSTKEHDFSAVLTGEKKSVFGNSIQLKLSKNNTICKNHKKPFEAFSFESQKFYCLNCMIEKCHQNQNVSDLNSSFKKFSDRISHQISAINSEGNSKYYFICQRINKKLTTLKENGIFALSKIDTLFSELQQLLIAKKHEITNNLK